MIDIIEDPDFTTVRRKSTIRSKEKQNCLTRQNSSEILRKKSQTGVSAFFNERKHFQVNESKTGTNIITIVSSWSIIKL